MLTFNGLHGVGPQKAYHLYKTLKSCREAFCTESLIKQAKDLLFFRTVTGVDKCRIYAHFGDSLVTFPASASSPCKSASASRSLNPTKARRDEVPIFLGPEQRESNIAHTGDRQGTITP
jgi:hypothetical protein